MPKVPKIAMSLRSVFYFKHLLLPACKSEISADKNNRVFCFFLAKIDPPMADLNFRHFSAI